jgi:hypothetical protein
VFAAHKKKKADIVRAINSRTICWLECVSQVSKTLILVEKLFEHVHFADG